MRLDARKGGYTDWSVYDAESCRILKNVAWVDDEIHQYGEWASASGFDVVTRQAKRIAIYPSRKLVIINPVEDSESEPVSATEMVPMVIEV